MPRVACASGEYRFAACGRVMRAGRSGALGYAISLGRGGPLANAIISKRPYIRQKVAYNWAKQAKAKRNAQFGALATTPSHMAWRGNAFELTCLAHVPQIKAALGILGVETQSYPWESVERGNAAQIDLVIDRRDGIIDLCEAKFTDRPYVLDKDGYEALVRKRDAFRDVTGTKKALHLVPVTASGLARGAYALNVQAHVGADDLFRLV